MVAKKSLYPHPKNPVILASGIMGTTGASLTRMAYNGAGAVVTKSIGPVPKKGHSNPTMIELENGFLNAMGLPNPSYTEFVQEIENAKNNTSTPIIASIFAGDTEGFVKVAEELSSANPDGFELNVSCPHAEGYGATIGCDSCLVEEITASVCDVIDVPVWVKLTPNVTNIVDIGKAAERGGADAVVSINTVRGMSIDINTGYPILGNRYGGLSGRAIRPIAVKCVYDLYASLDIPVVGVGGVSCWQDAVEMIMAGASAVQVGSAVSQSMDVFKSISSGIEDYLSANEYSTIDEIIGFSHKMG
ncbi:dihydroorotate dehydrogenase family protein [Methanohalobium evestigatum Z-7303]|uniref:Dihydroorotate dehydrogenase n=1 Tax=Methanohalobium evestigatum (strain ATCC BAA-1072 / DSM 3721 / NBRC 107634 / OCM 161 / Z-7303) TaxID=644295 RepID=D7E6C8_METEZ|nr:dihydroorotate dehydrogenase [Methanohalobium evestigatum]ADI73150.1 dihydroorotate dehydrogenase family protein [Methanohalobium evestigatum Z-7303]